MFFKFESQVFDELSCVDRFYESSIRRAFARSIADQAGYNHTTINKIVAELIRRGELKERGNGNLTEMP